jgi:pimeloyl-[acyl-carrier protein] methyl ester esterase
MVITRSGHGPDLVLVHGWAMHGGIFAPLTEHLQKHFTLHLVDLPGHGFSHDEPTDPDVSRVAAELAAQMPRAVWLGWSLGGLVTLSAALQRPDHVRGVVAMASSPRFLVAPDWPGVEAKMFAQFEAGLRDDYRQVVERFLALEALGSHDPQAELRDLRVRVFERGEPSLTALTAGMRWLEAADLRALLPQLAMPSLWIAGRRDRLVPPKAMRLAAGLANDGRFVEVASGHAPFIGQAPAVAQAIVDFVATLPT